MTTRKLKRKSKKTTQKTFLFHNTVIQIKSDKRGGKSTSRNYQVDIFSKTVGSSKMLSRQ